MTFRRAWMLMGVLALVVLAGCSDDSDDTEGVADQPVPSDEQTDDNPDPPDVSAEASGSGTGAGTLTLGDETWELDQVRCGFGEAGTGIEGAEVNLSARSGSLSLYLAVEPGSNYLEWTDLDDMDGYSWMSVEDPDVTISGRSVSATALLRNDAGGAEQQQGTLEVDCG